MRALAWYPIAAVTVSMVGAVAIKTGRDAIFFAQGGLHQLPLVYMLIAMAAIPGAMFHLGAMKVFGARRVRIGAFVAAAAIFLAFAPFVRLDQKLVMTAFFALAPAILAALFAGAWLLAADLLEGADDGVIRWAYSRIGAGSMVGGIVGGVLAKCLSLVLLPRHLVATGAIMFLICAEIIRRAHRQLPAATTLPAAEPISSSAVGAIAGTLIRRPYVLALIGVSSATAVAGLLIDFQFYALATITGHVDAQFFASFYLTVSLVALGLQLVASPRIQKRFGISGALLVLPAVLLGGSGLLIFSSTIASRAVLKVTESGLKASIHRSVWEQVFLRFQSATRGTAKVLVDGLFARVAEGLAALALYLWLAGKSSLRLEDLGLVWLAWALIGVLVLWLIITRKTPLDTCPVADPRLRLPDS